MSIEETFPNLPQPVEVQSLKRGGIYALVFERGLAEHSFAQVKVAVDEAEKRLGVKFLILDGGVRLAGAESINTEVVKELKKQRTTWL